MRCRFNRARYWLRMQAGEFIAITQKSNLARPLSAWPPGTLTQEVYYINRQTRVEMARVHQYVLPDGRILGSGKPDPKVIYLGGIMYQLHKGPAEVARDPSLRFPEGYARRAYVCWRRVKCFLIGR